MSLLALVFCGADAARAHGQTLPLHTEGRLIVDSGGKRVQLRAVNWYGAESPDFAVGGLQAQPLERIVSEIVAMKFNTVRLPWSNEMVERNPVVGSDVLAANPGLRGERALALFDRVVEALTGAGLMVVLDNHNSNAEWCCGDDGNTLWYNAEYPEKSWLRDWQAMAARYRGNRRVIGADLRNEPRLRASWGGRAETDWHAAAERGGNAVLTVNPDLLVFVEGVNYALDLSGVRRLPVVLRQSGRTVYSAHDYGYDYKRLAGYGDYLARMMPRWGTWWRGRTRRRCGWENSGPATRPIRV